MDPLRRLAAGYATRHDPAPAALGGRPVIAYVGRDVPRELIAAAGFAPFRLSGRPDRPPVLADEICGRGIDDLARSQLDRILRGELADCRGLVISADCEGSVRLYLYLRELQRLEPRPDIPPFTFVDVLHLPHRTSAIYTQRQLGRLADTLAEWGGTPITDAALRDAIASSDVLRKQLRVLGDVLRRGTDGPRLTGSDALQVIGGNFVMAGEEWLAAASELLADPAQLPAHEGRRVFLTGSAHDHPAAYELLESRGAVVVGEDHDWGDVAGEPFPTGAFDAVTALARGYGRGAPAAAGYSITERAAYTARRARDAGAELVIAWRREHDAAPAWDVPAQRQALLEHGIPLVALPAQPYAGGESAALDAALDAALATSPTVVIAGAER